MLYIALVLFFFAVALLVTQLFPEPQRGGREEGQLPPLYQTFRPLIKYLAGLNSHIKAPDMKQQYARRIERAGLMFEMSPDDFLAIKEIVLVVVGGFSALAYYFVLKDWTVIAVGTLLGFLLPDSRLSDAAKKRELAIVRALPDFLDLLTLAVEAGADFVGGLRKVNDRFQPGPLVWEFNGYLRSLMVGRSRADALRDLSHKLNLPDFTSFSNAVVQASEAGASIGPVLRMQAEDMRNRRFQRAEKLAQEAPVKMIMPLMAFIFPATFLMIIAPLFFQFRASGASGIL
jgi:tight adherence protein C